MKVGVIIPTRGDRPLFIDNFIRMINGQTLQPTLVYIVDYRPLNQEKDITQRYRIGYEWFKGMGMDVVAFMEDDDWYSPRYLEKMVLKWLRLGQPDLLGTNYTIYYHIKLFCYFTMFHDTRSSMMSTLMRPGLEFEWCQDSEPYTDMYLWTQPQFKKEIHQPDEHLCLGIKHGVGLTGGQSHTDRLYRYSTCPTAVNDESKSFLKATCDPASVEFYGNYFKNHLS